MLACLLAGCPGPAHPRVPDVAPVTIEIGRTGAALRGVAGDGKNLYAALAAGGKTSVQAWRPGPAWHVDLPGDGGPLALTSGTVLAASSTRMRGEPGSLVACLDAATGAERWRVAVDATGWALITSVAAAPDGGAVIGGAFGGTLRIAKKIVSSAGASDGFVARLSPAGDLVWLVRTGGAGADAVQGVAVAASGGGVVAIAGTFTAGADLAGVPLAASDERSPFGDGFVAELELATGARRWAQTFGGKVEDAVAGVAIAGDGHVAVAATARDAVHAGGADLVPHGAGDGLVAWFSPTGEADTAVLLGGEDFDGLDAIAPAGDRVVVGGFFSGAIELAGQKLSAGGGDDGFLAEIDASGAVREAWQVGGEGREEIAALAALPGGFVAGVTHTARAHVDAAPLPAPSDPESGAALVVRAAR